MIDTQFPQQGSLPEDQQNQNPNNEQQQVALPEEVSLVVDGDCPYELDLEDCLTGDALIDAYVSQYAEYFQQDAEDAYQGFLQDKDWLKMAISLWKTMRAYYAKDYDEAGGSPAQGSHAMKRKYEIYQQQANSLMVVFMKTALDRLAPESQEATLQYIEALLDKVRTEYEVAHSVSMGTSKMSYMYSLFKHVLDKKLQEYRGSTMIHQSSEAMVNGDDRDGCDSLEEFAYREFKKLNREIQDKLRRTRTKDTALTEIKYQILARYLGIPRERVSKNEYDSKKASISRAVDRLRKENG